MSTLFSWLYDLFIGPLAIAYGVAYHFCSWAFGYGYGLLALSVLTTLLLAPLRKKVASAQEEERRLRRVIEPQLARIKAESGGEERHQRIRRLYRRYAYHPIMSIRAMWGLLLQVPFILAAYHMLSELSALRLVSFWGIATLANPDGLIPGGVNVLPLLMTVFNLAAALLTPGATRRETAQAFVIALLFLALLYGAPSSLLIYWTANNFLSLASVLLQRRKPHGQSIDEDVVEAVAKTPAEGEEVNISSRWLMLYAFLLASLPVAWVGFLSWRVETLYSGKSPYFFTFSWVELLPALALFIAATLEIARLRDRRKARMRAWGWRIAGIVVGLGLAVFFVYGWAFSLKMRSVSGKLFIWTTLAYVLASVLAWVMASGGLNAGLWRLFRREAKESGSLLYWPAAIAIASLLVLFAPLASYQSSPETFTRSAVGLLRELLPYFLCLSYVFLYLWVVLTRQASSRLGLFLAYTALVGILMALAFPPAGLMVGDAFQVENPAVEAVGVVQDMLGLVIPLALLFILARYCAMRLVAYGLGISAFALAAFAVYVAVSMPGTDSRNDVVASTAAEANMADSATIANARPADDERADFPPYHHRLFSLSPDRPNVIIIMFDMFHGGDIQRMLDDDSETAERLPGFVWYRDTLSDGNNTLMSFPALLGGPDYTSGAINMRPDGDLGDKVFEATTILPRYFLKAGYAVSCYNIRDNLAVFSDKSLANLLGCGEEDLLDVSIPPLYPEMAKKAIKPGGAAVEGGHARYLLFVSLFRAVPNCMREGLVDLGVFETDDIVNKLYRDIAIPLLMPRFLSVDSPEPTFKIFATTFSHNPFLLGPDSLVPLVKGERMAVMQSGSAHYYTDRHAIRLMEKLVAELQAKGVYDNTRLIFASDHDNKYDSHPYLSGDMSFLLDDIKPHALLMVKDFAAKGPLITSDRLMQGHDVPALACQGLPEIANPPALPPDDPARERKHHVASANRLHHAKNSFINLRTYVIKGTMFESSNWKKAE